MHGVNTAVAEKTTPLDELNARQRNFCEITVGNPDLSQTECARRAGYKGADASLAVTATRLLRSAKVRLAIEYLSRPYRRKLRSLREKTLAVVEMRLDKALESESVDAVDLKAAELGCKIHGLFAPEQHVVKVDPHPVLPDSHIEELAERARQVKHVQARVLDDEERPSASQESATGEEGGDGAS